MAASCQAEPTNSTSCVGNFQLTENGLFKPIWENIDIGWQWNSLEDPKNRNKITCDFCGKVTSAGITRAKRHQMEIIGDVISCEKTPEDVKLLLEEAFKKKKKGKKCLNELHEDQDEDEVQEVLTTRSGKRPTSGSSSSMYVGKKTNVKGPKDLLMRKPETSLKLARSKGKTNTTDACDKDERVRTIQYISRFFCRNNIPFNVVESKSFKMMIKAIGNYGPHLKAPSYHEMRVPLLKKELEYTKKLLKVNVEEREMYGCSIRVDAWTDRKQMTLIKFLVNSPSGSMFVKSLDGSSYMKTGEQLFHLLDSFVEEVEEKNVLQVVTNNGRNYVIAGKLLQDKRKHLFWTPCASHCLNLILEDIGNLSRVKKTIKIGIHLVGFIYNNTLALNTMRKFTRKSELVRHGITRFATTFLTLQRLYNQRHNLGKMFTSYDWLKSNLANGRRGKWAANVVLMPSFWEDVVYCLKAMWPLIYILRLVENERKHTMGYIYEAMNRAKQAIRSSFNGNEREYKKILEIIDRRWDCQLHHPLYVAGHFLNPEFFYANPTMDLNTKIMGGVYDCINRLSENDEIADKISLELSIYKRAGGFFGKEQAIRQRTILSPVEWWKSYGQDAPSLMALAIKVLSLTCSSTGCERNWSIFEHIHSKKRSRREHQKLQDLVYIKYNQALKERFNCRDVTDPILDGINDSNEWLMGEMDGDGEDAKSELAFDDLSWEHVANVARVHKTLTYASRKTNRGIVAAPTFYRPSTSTGRAKGRAKGVVTEEVDEETTSEEETEVEEVEEEIYINNTSESEKDGEEPMLEDDN